MKKKQIFPDLPYKIYKHSIKEAAEHLGLQRKRFTHTANG